MPPPLECTDRALRVWLRGDVDHAVLQERREAWAEELLNRLTPAMSALGVLFLLVVVGEQFARSDSRVSLLLTVTGWALWAVLVEFLALVAPSTSRFLKRIWWQLLFLVLPFLRILRLVRAIRVLRTGRVLSSAIRSSRSARSVLGGRVGWLAVTCAITVLGASLLLYQSPTTPPTATRPMQPLWPPSPVNRLVALNPSLECWKCCWRSSPSSSSPPWPVPSAPTSWSSRGAPSGTLSRPGPQNRKCEPRDFGGD